MFLYRITKSVYADDLSGTGARLYGGRWNSVGKPVVYLAGSQSLALLEVLVHLPPALVPADFVVVTFETPDDVTNINIEILPTGWNRYPEPISLRYYGDAFIAENKHLLLKVPSAVVPQEYNYLLNPRHPRASKVKIISREPFNFDRRLI